MPGKLAWVFTLIVLPLIGGLVYLITDVVRRNELSSREKSLWVVLMLVLPVIGMVTYLIASRSARVGGRPPAAA